MLEGCTFNFDSVLTDVATMVATARVVENVGVAAVSVPSLSLMRQRSSEVS